MSEHPMIHVLFLDTLRVQLAQHGLRAWLVGGSLRDALLGRPSLDIDLAVDGDAGAFGRALADATGGSWVPLDDERDTARVVWTAHADGWPYIVDIARLRAPTIEDDLRDRDFTINALALPIVPTAYRPQAIIDPMGGIADIQNKRLRLCNPGALERDPARMLRAVRIAGQLQFSIDADLDVALREQHQLIKAISAERVRDELMKILALPDAGRWVRYLDDVRLLTTIIPPLEASRRCDQPSLHAFAVLDHLLEAVVCADWLLAQIARDAGTRAALDDVALPAAVQRHPSLTAHLPYAGRLHARFEEIVDGVPRAALFKLAVLLHDVSKPETKATKPDGGVSFYDHQTIGAERSYEIARRLRLSRATSEYVRAVVREHMRPGQLADLGDELTTRAVYRFFRATGAAGPDVLLHTSCDYMAMRGPALEPSRWQRHVEWTAHMLETWAEEQTHPPEPLVRGEDVLRQGVPQGPRIGQLLEEVREAQAVGEITTRDEALAWLRGRTGAGS
jgi:tRNA nucleotidyltransferase/poly(A) polymerase